MHTSIEQSDDPNAMFNFLVKFQESQDTSPITDLLLDRFGQLRKLDNVSQAAFDLLMNSIDQIDNPRSFERLLWFEVRSWGYLNGFSVPCEFDRLSLGYVVGAQCLLNDQFQNEISKGIHYAMLSTDLDTNQILITNDLDNDAWYPVKIFSLHTNPHRQFTKTPSPLPDDA